MRILVTNDDGIAAPGIAALASGLASDGHDVLVAAPASDSSGSSAAVGPRNEGTLVYETVKLEGAPELAGLAIVAFPAFIVYAACRGLFGQPPDVVLSGINRGRNVGGAVFHSGTVGAALTASQLGRSGMAVSLQARGSELHYETAAAVARQLLPLLSEVRTGTVLNLNVPNLPLAELRGVRRASIARTGPILPPIPQPGTIPATPAERGTPEQGSDDDLTLLGWATVTALVPVSEDPDRHTASVLDHALRSFAR